MANNENVQAPTFRYGASYYPLHRDRRSWNDDLDAMRDAKLNTLRLGDFSWALFETADGQWDFEWFDTFLDLAWSRKIDVLFAPPLRSAPAWLVAQDPTMQILDADGRRLAFGSRYTFCIHHPLFRKKALAVTQRLVERYAQHPSVIGWHLDNEFGDEPDCHCPHCQAHWHAWLRRKYGDVDALNRAWGTRFWSLTFSEFAQVPTPAHSKTVHNPALLLNWRRFRSDATARLIREQADAVRKVDTEKPITTNLQCLWNPRTDYFDLKDTLDVAGLNYYPPYGEDARRNALGLAVARGSVGPGLEIHELRNGPHGVPGRPDNTPEPGEIERLTLHTVAHGADAIYYFQWAGVRFGAEQTHGTIVDYDGRPRRAYRECQHIGKRLERLAPALAGTHVQSETAVLFDFQTQWIMLGGSEWVGPGHLYLTHARRLYNAARSLGVNCDATGRDADWSRYKVLIVPVLDAVDDQLADRLKDYVSRGGTLLWHPLSGLRNPDTEIYPSRLHPELEGLFGLSVREFATAAEGESRHFTYQGQRYEGQLFMDLPDAGAAEALACYEDCWFAGTPAVCSHAFGAGRAIYCTTFAEERFYRDLLRSLFDAADVRPILGTEPPEAIEVCERTAPDGRRLVFMINTTGEAQTFDIDAKLDDLWNNQKVSGTLQFSPWQVRVCQDASQPAPRAKGEQSTRARTAT